MKKILVTGGAGYIGSHTCKLLAENGYDPIVYDDLSTGYEWAVKWGDLEVGSLRDESRLLEVCRQHKPDVVLHFASFINVGESVSNPIKYYGNNVGGTMSLLRIIQQCGIGHLVYSSSCAVYGVSESLSLRENHPQAPHNPYGWSKFMCERIIADFERAFGLRHVALRYFNAAGADPGGQIGEAHLPETHIIPLVLQVAKRECDVFTFNGNDYDTDDGTCVRDYIHVVDLAAAHLLALEYLLNGGDSQAFNLGNGTGYSVQQVIEAAREVTGHAIPTRVGKRRKGDISILVSDSTRAHEILGWLPSRPDLATQVEDAWRWHKNFDG